jgi:hypothetical protein
MKVIIDPKVREPFTFAGYSDTVTGPSSLNTGLYSLDGLSGQMAARFLGEEAFENYSKNKSAWLNGLEREVERADSMDDYKVIFDLSLLDEKDDFYSKKQEFLTKILGALKQDDYYFPLTFVENSRAAESGIWNFFREYLEMVHSRYARVVKAHGAALPVEVDPAKPTAKVITLQVGQAVDPELERKKEQGKLDREISRLRGQQNAMMAASGLDMNSGALLDIGLDMVEEQAIDRQHLGFQGKLGAWEHMLQAKERGE